MTLNKHMYEENFLLRHLRSASLGRESKDFVKGDNPRSFAMLFSNVEKLAAALTFLGLEPGDRVAAQVGKSPEALELYLATVMAGGVFLPLNPAYTAPEVGYFLNDATPKVFVVDPAKLESLADDVADIPYVLTMDASGKGGLIDLAQDKDGFTAVKRGPDDLAAILYTSGTTGRSKGAMLSHKALVSNSLTLMDYWQFTHDDVLIHALPIFHTHGLFVATNVALMAGASIIFMPKFDTDAIIAALPKATALMGVPTFYTRLLDHPDLDRGRVATMRLFISGSAPLLAQTHKEWFAKTGHHILERYGMTETNMNTSNPYSGERRLGTVGFPLPGVDLRIVNETGEYLESGEVGTIEVRGDNVFSGYWQMPEKTAEELRSDGWFITGDLGVQDKDGYVSIVGRSKDLVISGGFNIYPKEVESVIDDIEGVTESAVIGVPHPDFGEGIVAIVVCDSDFATQEITKICKANLADYKLPKKIIVVPELPRNTMGKVQKKSLREDYSALFGG